MISISRVGIVPHRHCVVLIQQIYNLYLANIEVVQIAVWEGMPVWKGNLEN